ncbi:hypothetical protein AltI4_20070 [Alteromonas sp. I4]|nr:hypothetical protein AltI4_20070 [Alteromonas sp. I4]
MRLALPLHCYDEAGVVLPPTWWYGLLAFGARDVLLILMISALPGEADTLFELIFVHSHWLVWQVLAAIPFAIAFLLTSFRSVLWKKQRLTWRKWLKPLCWLGIGCQVTVMGMLTVKTGGQFNVYYGSIFIALCVMAYMLVKSQYLQIMIEDWRRLPEAVTPSSSK